MKIGFIGNVNNYPFQIAKELKKKGHEIIFIVTDEPALKLNRPEFFDHSIKYPYDDWIIEIALKRINYYLRLYFPRIGYRPYINLLNSCQGVVTNDFAHELRCFVDKKIPFINLFSGSDLDVYAQEEFMGFDNHVANPFLKMLQPIKNHFTRQRKKRYLKGIRESIGVSYYPIETNPIGDSLLNDLKDEKFERFERWNSVQTALTYSPPPSNKKLVLLSAVRHLWKKPLPYGYNPWEDKGNDVMIRGIHLFKTRNPAIDFEVHLFEKGNHLLETKELIRSLNLHENVIWHSEISLLEMNDWYSRSDIILEQFGSHIMGGAGVFPMIMGKPVIANGRKDILERIIPEKVPYCYAEDESDICEWLERLSASPSLREKIGINSRDYMLRNDSLPKEVQFILSTFGNNLNTEG